MIYSSLWSVDIDGWVAKINALSEKIEKARDAPSGNDPSDTIKELRALTASERTEYSALMNRPETKMLDGSDEQHQKIITDTIKVGQASVRFEMAVFESIFLLPESKSNPSQYEEYKKELKTRVLVLEELSYNYGYLNKSFNLSLYKIISCIKNIDSSLK